MPDFHGEGGFDSSGWTEVASSEPKVELNCKVMPFIESDDTILKCNGVKFLEGDLKDLKMFGGIRIVIPEYQGNQESSGLVSEKEQIPFEVDDFTIEIV